MRKMNIIFVIFLFSIMLSVISIVKNQARALEKNIFKVERKIFFTKKDLHETELDYYYLTSPSYLSEKIKNLSLIEYTEMEFSRIYLNFDDFINSQKKITILNIKNEKIKKE